MKPQDYKYIAGWHYLTGSEPYYVNNLQAQAARENAPADACYRDHDSREWVCAKDVKNRGFIREIEQWIKRSRT